MYSKEAIMFRFFTIGALIGVLVVKDIEKKKYLRDDNIYINISYLCLFTFLSLINYLLMFILNIKIDIKTINFTSQTTTINTILFSLICIIFGIYWFVFNFYIGFWFGKIITNIRNYFQYKVNDIKVKTV